MPFCFQSLRPEPDTSPRVLVADVPARRLAYRPKLARARDQPAAEASVPPHPKQLDTHPARAGGVHVEALDLPGCDLLIGDVPLDETETVAPGIHLGSSVALLQDLASHPQVPVRVFSGYAGWGPGQLEREIHENSWLHGECAPELIFDTPSDQVWEAALRRMDLPPEMIASSPKASA